MPKQNTMQLAFSAVVDELDSAITEQERIQKSWTDFSGAKAKADAKVNQLKKLRDELRQYLPKS